jgi:hypothetical protein
VKGPLASPGVGDRILAMEAGHLVPAAVHGSEAPYVFAGEESATLLWVDLEGVGVDFVQESSGDHHRFQLRINLYMSAHGRRLVATPNEGGSLNYWPVPRTRSDGDGTLVTKPRGSGMI